MGDEIRFCAVGNELLLSLFHHLQIENVHWRHNDFDVGCASMVMQDFLDTLFVIAEIDFFGITPLYGTPQVDEAFQVTLVAMNVSLWRIIMNRAVPRAAVNALPYAVRRP